MNQRIGIIGENSIAYVRTLLEIWNSGNCAVLVDWRIPVCSALDMLKKAGVTCCYLDENLECTFTSKSADISFIPMIHTAIVEPLTHDIAKHYHMRFDEDEAAILFSSGTTGIAKGIVLSHRAITTNAQAILKLMNLGNKSAILIVKPLSHSSTLVGEMLVGLIGGFELVISRTTVAPSFSLSNINKFNISIMCVNPTLLRLYIDAAENKSFCFSSLNTLYTSGAMAGKALLEHAKDVFACDVLNMYGTTEAGPRVSMQKKGDPVSSVGLPLQGVNVCVRNNQGHIIGSNTKGNIYIKTPCLFSKYLMEQNNRRVPEDDWFNTGDLGYVDDMGYIYIIGRADNMIITGAYNVCPEDIEEVICSIPGVTECIVYGIHHHLKGIAMACRYVCQEKGIDGQYIRKYLSHRLASYEIPSEFHLCEQLPKTPGGKILRTNFESD